MRVYVSDLAWKELGGLTWEDREDENVGKISRGVSKGIEGKWREWVEKEVVIKDEQFAKWMKEAEVGRAKKAATLISGWAGVRMPRQISLGDECVRELVAWIDREAEAGRVVLRRATPEIARLGVALELIGRGWIGEVGGE